MFEVAVIVVLILINGFFVMSEIAIVSSRKVRLEKKAEEGNSSARAALKLANNPQRTLSTIQFFITLIGFIAAAYGGNELAGPIARHFEQFEWTREYAEALGISTIVAFTTFISIVLGELVPKTIALSSPEKTALRSARLMEVLSWIATPIVFFLQGSTRLILKVFGFKGNNEPPITEEELQHMIEQGSEHGVIEEVESQMMRGVFRIGDRKVSALMTHRMDIVWIDVNASQEEVFAMFRTSIHSSFPVCDGDLDHIVGVVFIKDIATQIAEKGKINIRHVMRQPLFVPETMDALELLEQFKKSRVHSGFVVNEFGVLEGIVSFHDILESIVGGLPLEATQEAYQMAVEREDGSWLIDGTMQIDEWQELLRMRELNEQETGTYNTLGGFIMHRLGRIPKEADKFEFKGFTFEVMDMDGKRVDKVLVSKIETDESDEAED